MQGLGFLGFRSTTKTNWFADDNSIITTVSKYQSELRGANIENYTILGLGNYSASDYPAPANYITKSTIAYVNSLSANKVFNSKMISSQESNGLDATSTETAIVYDIFNNPTQSTTVVKNGGTTEQTTVSDLVYAPPTSLPYVIGRPTNKNQSVTVSGDTMTSEEQYVYSNNLLTQIKKKGHNTNFITEDNVYDAFGNITKKTITASGLAPRETNYEYDLSGRFLIKSSDIEGLPTTFAYNPSNGLLNSETNPYGLTTSYLYDCWFKKKTTTDYLGKSANITFVRNGSNIIITRTGQDGTVAEEVFDDLGRKTKSGVKDIMGTFSYVSYLYDIYDRNIKTSEPYTGSNLSQWNETKYDVYGRITQNIAFTGKTTNISYSGLTTTVSEIAKTKTATKNAIGNVISMTDSPGGTINYTYYANGTLKSSNYDGVITTIEQDGWGRKTKLTDPSAGTYTYTYNDLGEALTEVTPNGTTTFTLSSLGKLAQKTISGTNTNSTTTYNYDGTTKLLTSSTFVDALENNATITKAYIYDSSKRLVSNVETTPYATFTKQLTYDAFGRLSTENSIANAAGKSSAKTVQHTYKNGQAWQIIDTANSQILWQTNSVDARGQLTGATMANGAIAVANTYDSFGLPTQIKYDKVGSLPGNSMTLTTSFDPQRGNLTSRTNNLFNWDENFTYDALDRLTSFKNAIGGIETQNYDDRGRITENAIGTYNYTNTTKAYQNTSITLTPEALGYYGMREGIFGDSMEQQNGWDNAGLDLWAVYQQATITYDSSRANTGKYSLKLSNPSSSEKIIHADKWITIDNAVDTYYTYSAWVYSDNPTADLFLFMKTQNETGYFTHVSSCNTKIKNNWVKIENVFLVPANIKKLNLRLDNNGLGNVWFDDVKIQKTSILPTSDRKLNITYNAFKSPVQIEETGVDKISFTYNDGNNRSSMFYGGLEIDKLLRTHRKYYSSDGTMEIKENRVTGAIEFVTYIGGDGYSAPIVLKSDGTTQNYLYLQRDYQGSIVGISDASGAVLEKRLFDAWGNIIKVQDGAGNVLAGLTILDRGYTGHEHLQSVGLIHMNGRLYDAKLHRFLQPDNYVQDPFNTQNYNRYGYCWNNPLKYSDPSGEWIHILVGAVIGGVVNWAINGAQFNAKGLAYFGVGALAGGLTAMGAGGLSSALAGGSFSAGALGTAAACSVGSGFMSGAVVGAAGGLVGGFATGFGNGLVDGKNIGDCFKNGIRDGALGAITGSVIGGVAGGIDAAMDGRDFWSGKKWVEVNTGVGKTLSSSSNVNFSDPKWDVEESMNLKQFSQGDDYTCTYRCKLSVDDYFGSTGQQNTNKGWLRYANNNNGVTSNRIEGFYRMGGYSTNSFSGSMTPNNGLPWIANEMRNNRVVQIGWYANSSSSIGHASLISKIKYLQDFSKFRIYLMDPAGHSTSATFKNIYQILSIWK